MKASNLLYALIVASTALANDFETKYAFYAKFQNSTERIGVSPSGSGAGEISYLSYDPPNDKPMEFTYDGTYAFTDLTDSPEPVGLDYNALVVGPEVNKVSLLLDGNGRVQMLPMRWCHIYGHPTRAFVYGDSIFEEVDCLDVELYFKPIGTKTENQDDEESPDQNVNASDGEGKLAFFTKSEGKIEALVGIQPGVGVGQILALSHGKGPHKTLEVTYNSKNFVVYSNPRERGNSNDYQKPVNVNVFHGALAAGSDVDWVRLQIDDQHKVTTKLVSCSSVDNVNDIPIKLILTHAVAPECPEVDIYLLPFEIKTEFDGTRVTVPVGFVGNKGEEPETKNTKEYSDNDISVEMV